MTGDETPIDMIDMYVDAMMTEGFSELDALVGLAHEILDRIGATK